VSSSSTGGNGESSVTTSAGRLEDANRNSRENRTAPESHARSHARQKRQRPVSSDNLRVCGVHWMAWVGHAWTHLSHRAMHLPLSISGRPAKCSGRSGAGPFGYRIVR